MKKTLLQVSVGILAVLFAVSATAYAASSSKFSAQLSSVALVQATTGNNGYSKVLATSIKTPNKKDLLIGASFETGLYTKTVVKSSAGILDTSTAVAGIKVMVIIDDNWANPIMPGEVIYDKRAQTLSAKLGGILQSCTDLNGDGVIDVLTECTFTDEEIGLILDTMGAHHFNFVAADLAPGDHRVEVWAKIETSTTSVAGSAEAKALVGKGSLTVEEVKATNAAGGIVFLE